MIQVLQDDELAELFCVEDAFSTTSRFVLPGNGTPILGICDVD